MLLPRKGKLAELIVKDCHYTVNHGGQKETLEQLRSTMWLPKARQFVRKVIFHCLVCKRLNGPCYGVPPQADLPDFRVQEQPAFSKVGVDFGGPIYIKEGVGENKVIKKSYFCIFSCTASRAIHLEVVTDLRTETFLNCLRRFTSRRGIPEMLITDNASTYKRANKLLIVLFKRREVQAYLANQHITWHYNLELAPWWGGFYERHVGLVKKSLKRILGKALLTLEEIMTILCDIEGVLNSRPITYIETDGIGHALTPSHLVCGKRLSTLPTCSAEDELIEYPEDQSTFTRRMIYLSTLMKNYWKSWLNDYIVNLREFHNCKAKKAGHPMIEESDVVIIKEDNVHRGNWRLARVDKLLKGTDGEIRGAEIVVADKNGKLSRIWRALQLLYPLEAKELCSKKPKELNVKQNTVEPVMHRKSKREAALTGNLLRKLRS